MVICAACGSDNEAGSQYCRSCARRLDEKTREEVTRKRAAALQSQPTGVRWVAIVITVVVLIMVVAVVAVLVGH